MSIQEYREAVLELVTKMRDAHELWEAAKKEYVDVKSVYTQGLKHDKVMLANAEYKAASDPRIKKAISDCAHYRAETQAYAAMISALQTINWT